MDICWGFRYKVLCYQLMIGSRTDSVGVGRDQPAEDKKVVGILHSQKRSCKDTQNVGTG